MTARGVGGGGGECEGGEKGSSGPGGEGGGSESYSPATINLVAAACFGTGAAWLETGRLSVRRPGLARCCVTWVAAAMLASANPGARAEIPELGGATLLC